MIRCGYKVDQRAYDDFKESWGGLNMMNSDSKVIKRVLSLLHTKYCKDVSIQTRTDKLVQYSFHGYII